MIGFFPPSSEGYGSVHFGTRSKDGQINFEGAVNDQGLAWDINSTPHSKLIPESNPHKPYYLSEDNFLTRITKKASSVEQAMRIAGLYDFGDEMLGQIHIADASGDAVVISGGPDGKIAFTRKEPGNGYHLSTNFNLAIPEKGPVDFRWETAGTMLEGLIDGEELNPEYALSILEAVKLRSITSLTLYSNVLDLKNNKIYLYYMSQFNEVAVIEMEKEFTKGRRVVEMRELFSPEIAAAGDANYQSFAIRFL
jgi:penicillin V acylase-like amidase (Ntn superfamily)